MSSKGSVCTKHTPAPGSQALGKTCPAIAGPKCCGCTCLGTGCVAAGKWRQKPEIRCQRFESVEERVSSWLGKKHVCGRTRRLGKGSRGAALWLTASWDGRRTEARMRSKGMRNWDWNQGGQKAGHRWEVQWEKLKTGWWCREEGLGFPVTGLDKVGRWEKRPLAACLQGLWQTPSIKGHPLCTHETTHKVSHSP